MNADPEGSWDMRYKKLLCVFLWVLLIIMPAITHAGDIEVISVDGPITPVTAKYIGDAVRSASRREAECLVIEIDTPGGLMLSTFSIDKELLSDRVPVVVYISPSGGRAASAGVYIAYAAHFVAMAPGTNIGAAHPVTMSGKDTSKVMLEKVTNDAVAHIKALADRRKRNKTWAELAVRESVSITEQEALKLGVTDFIAENLDGLLKQLDGKTLMLQDGEKVLRTGTAEIRRYPMSWRYRILDKISDPNIAYLLMLAGIIGIFFELQNPGAVFPGALGGISLILAFFALQVLPISAAGILLILLAVVFFILEVYITSFGLLTIGGIVAMTLGSLMLFKTPSLRVSLSVIIPVVLATAAFFLFAAGMVLKTHRKRITTGYQGLIGERGVVLNALKPEGQVLVHGEVWEAFSSEPLKKGDKIEVIEGGEGLILKVKQSK